MYAQHRNISKEEAINVALEEFEQLELPNVQEEVKKNVLDSIKKASNSDLEWEESGDKEKYPHLYMLEKLNEQMLNALNLPKELLCKLLYFLTVTWFIRWFRKDCSQTIRYSSPRR